LAPARDGGGERLLPGAMNLRGPAFHGPPLSRLALRPRTSQRAGPVSRRQPRCATPRTRYGRSPCALDPLPRTLIRSLIASRSIWLAQESTASTISAVGPFKGIE